MKKILSLTILFAFITFGISCKKKDDANKLTEFDIDYTTNLTIPSSSIPVSAPTQTVEFTTPNVATQQSTKFSEQSTTKSLIDQIKMTRFNLSAVGSGANLDYLKSLSIYIKASGVGEELIGTKTNIPTGITSASLDLTDVNIKDYIFQENIQFRVVATFDVSATTASQTLKLDQTVHVKATLIK